MLKTTFDYYGLEHNRARSFPVRSAQARVSDGPCRRVIAIELLFVGRFDNQKGGDILLAAFSKVFETAPNLTLNFVGPDFGVEVSPGHAL